MAKEAKKLTRVNTRRLNQKLRMQKAYQAAQGASTINPEQEASNMRSAAQFAGPLGAGMAGLATGLKAYQSIQSSKEAASMRKDIILKYALTAREASFLRARKYNQLMATYQGRISTRERLGKKTRLGKLGRKWHGWHKKRLVKGLPRARKSSWSEAGADVGRFIKD